MEREFFGRCTINKYLLVLCLSLFFVPGLPAMESDLTAADEASKRYRQKQAHPIIHKVPSGLQKSVFRNPERYLPRLVFFLVRGSRNQFETVKRLHDWVTYNISYDVDLFYGLSSSGSRGAYGALRQRKTTCGGFASIFLIMARIARLEVTRITAYSKSYGRVRTGQIAGHAWNGVKIKGKWYHVDCSADSRSSFKHGKFSEKRKYKYYNLFVHPRAKILTNLPKKRWQQFLKRPLTFNQWRRAPRVNRFFYGFKIQFLSNMRRLITEGKKMREGGNLFSLFDKIVLSKRKLHLQIQSPKRLELFTYLKGEDGKHYRGNVYNYYENGRMHIVVSPPRPGKYKLHLRARVFGVAGTSHTFYWCMIEARKFGVQLPEYSGKLYHKKSSSMYGIRIRQTQLSGDRCMVDLSWPKGHSAYVTVGAKNKKRGYRRRIINYLSPNRRQYYFSTEGSGPHFLKIYAKVRERQKYHTQVAVARISPTDHRQAHPLDRLIYWKRWRKSGVKILSHTIGSLGSDAGFYSIRLRVPAGRELICSLRDSKKKFWRGYYLYDKQGRFYTLHFSSPGRDVYLARVSLRNKKGRYNTILSFSFKGKGRAPKLPRLRMIYRLGSFDRYGIKIISQNVEGHSTDQRLYKLALLVPSKYGMSCTLRDEKNRRMRKHYFYQRRGRRHIFYFTAPGRGRYLARIYLIHKKNGKRRYRSVLYFRIYGKRAGPKLPFAGQLYLYRHFYRKGFKLITRDNGKLANGTYCVKIKAPYGIKMTCLLLNRRNRRVRGAYRTEQRDSSFYFYFMPPDSSYYKAKIYYLKKNGKRRTLGWIKIGTQK